MFRDNGFRAAWLAQFGATARIDHDANVDAALDALALHLETHLDVEGLLSVATPPATAS